MSSSTSSSRATSTDSAYPHQGQVGIVKQGDRPLPRPSWVCQLTQSLQDLQAGARAVLERQQLPNNGSMRLETSYSGWSPKHQDLPDRLLPPPTRRDRADPGRPCHRSSCPTSKRGSTSRDRGRASEPRGPSGIVRTGRRQRWVVDPRRPGRRRGSPHHPESLPRSPAGQVMWARKSRASARTSMWWYFWFRKVRRHW